MRRLTLILFVLAAACGGTAAEIDDPTATSSVDQPSTTLEDGGAGTSEPTGESSTTETTEANRSSATTDSATSDLPLAPDFTLELGTGGEFTLSSTENPVYLVFWAEW